MRVELEEDVSWRDKALLGRTTILRWLKEAGLTRPHERHQDLPQLSLTSAEAPPEEWELDARGYEKVPDVGIVALLSMNNRFGRVKVLSHPCWLNDRRVSRHPTTEDYQLAFRLAASPLGLPDRLLAYRDSVFYDNKGKSPFPARFHLWLQALGVDLAIGPAHRPQKRSIMERSYQTWGGQVLKAQAFAAWEHLPSTLERRWDLTNEDLLCSGLDGRAPLVAYPQARIPRRVCRPEREPELMDLERVQADLTQR